MFTLGFNRFVRCCFVTGIVGTGLCTGVCRADTVLTPTDLGTISTSNFVEVAGPQTSPMLSSATTGGKTLGELTDVVYQNGTANDYFYEETLAPQTLTVSEFNTGFTVAGFTAGVDAVGWQFTGTDGAANAGFAGNANDFGITLDADGKLHWYPTNQVGVPDASLWTTGDSITLFFESSLPPGPGLYNMIDDNVGSAMSFAPTAPTSVPLPDADTMGAVVLACVAGASLLRRRVRDRV